MRYFLLAALSMIFTTGTAQAFEASSTAALVKGTKVYQAGVNSDLRPEDSAEPSAEPATVEPAAGADAEAATPPERDTTKEMQQQMKLPRKN